MIPRAALAVALAVSILVVPLALEAQQAGKVYRSGCLMGDSRETAMARSVIGLLPELLRAHGYDPFGLSQATIKVFDGLDPQGERPDRS